MSETTNETTNETSKVSCIVIKIEEGMYEVVKSSG